MALPLVVTPGDPLGVGPEVAVAGILQTRVKALVLGDRQAFEAEAHRQGLVFGDFGSTTARVRFAEPRNRDLPVEVAALEQAVRLCLEGEAAGLVTGPIHKKRLQARGFSHPGHTGYLGALCGVPDPVMAFVGRKMRVALVTVHVPLREVPDRLTAPLVLHTLRLAAAALADELGIVDPRLVVAGLNPHAGEEGLLGFEEQRVIAPAIAEARASGLRADGPLPADVAARRVATGQGDLLVAMYHDQGLVPLKLLDFGHSVNWTLGLPILRTSVDHGTADDIAGRGIADPGSMVAAIRLAGRIAARRQRQP
jgi:4-hydroxythreonine-4-phosphate dehydrogenase